jgi:hypothetical protein
MPGAVPDARAARSLKPLRASRRPGAASANPGALLVALFAPASRDSLSSAACGDSGAACKAQRLPESHGISGQFLGLYGLNKLCRFAASKIRKAQTVTASVYARLVSSTAVQTRRGPLGLPAP